VEALMIVQAMAGHLGNEDMQMRGCGALWLLAGNAVNAVRIGEGGGVEAIVQAVGGHCGSEGVQRNGCGALLSLALEDDNR
jgi:hypothetical protein